MNILPLPSKVEEHPGFFQLNLETAILTDDANRSNASFLSSVFDYALHIRTLSLPAKNTITLRIDPSQSALGNEGYRLEVRPEAVRVGALTVTGVFYGIQSLRQMVTDEGGLPCVVIEDQPRFAWRGFMLDEGRHFHGKDTVRLLLDLMALQKMNVLHWHLTEDQGWRIEIQKYPRLTEVGSRRAGTVSAFSKKQHNSVPHTGFYTQAEIRAIVAYAAERHITIVPEIELPGHSTAALAAYPELSCTGGPFEVATGFGIFPDIYCAGKETTFTFLQDVLDEIMVLFPSPFLHIGGDEAPKARWKVCPECQRRIRAENLADEHALQVYFTNRIMAYLESKGRRAVGWNEILGPGLATGAVVQYWVGSQKKLVEAMHRDGRQVVMSTYLDAYLDHSHELMPLSRAYRYNPIPRRGPEACVLGVEFPLWTEWVPTRARLDYQVFPRLCALAEVGWTPKERMNFTDFRRRLRKFTRWLDRFQVHYAPPGEAEPPRWKRLFSIFSIFHAQTKTAD